MAFPPLAVRLRGEPDRWSVEIDGKGSVTSGQAVVRSGRPEE
jgi:hypothetical protein